MISDHPTTVPRLELNSYKNLAARSPAQLLTRRPKRLDIITTNLGRQELLSISKHLLSRASTPDALTLCREPVAHFLSFRLQLTPSKHRSSGSGDDVSAAQSTPPGSLNLRILNAIM